MRVVIGGVSGFIGRHLKASLTERGHEVIALSRKPRGKKSITWDQLYQSGLPNDVQAVVNLSGANILDPTKRWTPEYKREVFDSRIETTSALARIINKSNNPPKVFVSTSAIGYYPPSSTAEYTEDSPPGNDMPGQLCKQWEVAAQLKDSCTTRLVIVRTGLVLGRDGGLIKNLFLPFFLGVGGRMGSGQQWFPWIHIRDIAGIYVHAIENDHVSGVLNGVSPESVTNAQFSSTFAYAMWRPALFPVPGFALRAVFGEERANMVIEGQRVVPRRTLESGYKFVYSDLKSACADCSRLIYAV